MPKKIITYGKTARDRKRERDAAEQKAAAKAARRAAPVEEPPAEPVEAVDPIAEAPAEQPAEAPASAPKKRNVRSIVIGAVGIVLAVVLIVTGILLMLTHRYPTDYAYATVTLEFGDKTYSIEYAIDGHGSPEEKVRLLADNFVSQAVAGVYNDSVFHKYVQSGSLEGGRYATYTYSGNSGTGTELLSNTRNTGRYYSVTGSSSAEVFPTSPQHVNDDWYVLYAVPHGSSTTTYRAGFGIVFEDTSVRGQAKGVAIGVATAKGVTVLKTLAEAFEAAYPGNDSDNDSVNFQPIRLVGVSVKGNLFRGWEKYDLFQRHKSDDYRMLNS